MEKELQHLVSNIEIEKSSAVTVMYVLRLYCFELENNQVIGLVYVVMEITFTTLIRMASPQMENCLKLRLTHGINWMKLNKI